MLHGYHPAMRDVHSRSIPPPRSGQSLLAWLQDWWQLAQTGSALMVLVLSPSSYGASDRGRLMYVIYTRVAPIIPGFGVGCALFTVVLTRIMLTTAATYGLTQYALQVLIRVLVLELIPLTSALYVAMRCTIPDGVALSGLQPGKTGQPHQQADAGFLRQEVLPRVLAGMVAGVTLAALSGLVALAVAYLVGYGATLSGLAAYTRMAGQVFTQAVCLILVLKSLLFSMVVALVPMASALYSAQPDGGSMARTNTELRALVRMFALLLILEFASLVGNYY